MANKPTSVILDSFHQKLLLRLRKIVAKKSPEITITNTVIVRMGLHALQDELEGKQ
jgi:hypothetical protein